MALFHIEVQLDTQVTADDEGAARLQVQAALQRTFAYMGLDSKPVGFAARIQQVHPGRECPGHVVDVARVLVGPAYKDDTGKG